jgi:putative transposase
MMSDLRAGDKLALPGKPDSYFEVLDGRIHAGTIHIFDAEKREAGMSMKPASGLASAGSLILHRKDAACRHRRPVRHDTTLHAGPSAA